MFAPGHSGPIVRPPSPDRLDRMLQVNNSLDWLAVLALVLVIAAGLVWSVLSTAPVKVSAQGMILSSLGISDITTVDGGRVVEIMVRAGDTVRKGDLVALVGQVETTEQLRTKQIELGGLQDERRRLTEFQSRVELVQDQFTTDRRSGLEARVTSLAQRVARLTEIEANIRSLVDKGYALPGRLLEATNERTLAQDELAQVRASLVQLVGETEGRVTQNERELLATDMRMASVAREIDVLTSQLQRSTTVAAPADGTVVEIGVSPNELVRAGAPIMRMLPTAGPETLQAVAYVAAADGKRVRPGMRVQVVPANARLQRDGYMEARVLEVASLPANQESMQRILKNSGLVTQLTEKGPPYEVVVSLDRDLDSPTGFRWSTGRGLATPPESGTLVEAKFVVDRIPIIALVVPRAETLLVWLRGLAG